MKVDRDRRLVWLDMGNTWTKKTGQCIQFQKRSVWKTRVVPFFNLRSFARICARFAQICARFAPCLPLSKLCFQKTLDW